ncbi:hypothetical protein R3W88_024592 [Solanum pinnatisectum]|uniref:NB-ARC domain-containing protein n=1 Tax=Solanum pinnatisectum TaxID=50273 RepID=A0AAV9M104_9SOLN|nr:hypothetical protein R3W88_024592 [Solanum pinnatisectum]
MDEVLLRFHEYIFEYLLLKDEADLKLTDSDKLKGFYHSLLLLVTLLINPTIQYIECKKQNNLLWEIGTLAIQDEAAIHLSYEDSLQSNKSRKVNLLLQLLTVDFMLIKCEGKLTDQLKHKVILETEFMNLVENAYEELIFLRIFLIDLLGQQTIELNKSDGLLMHAEVAAHKATLISTCSYESFMDGSSYRDMSLSLSDFLKETKSIRELCFQLLDESASYITLTYLKCFINMLLDMLNHLHSWDDVIPVVRNQIPVAQEKLEFLADILKPCNMHTELKDLMELVTGPNFPKTNGLGFHNCFLGKLEELLHSKLDLITKLKPQIVLVKEGLLIVRSFFDHTEETYDENDEICGLIISATEMAYEAMSLTLAWHVLTHRCTKLIGYLKFTYNDPTVVSHFDVRAMRHVTQVYSWRDLLLSILNDVLEPADRTKKGDDQLATELHHVLLTKRFLILIDDEWDTTTWDYLNMCFQGSQNRSRIILTRLYEVAHYAKYNSEPHRLCVEVLPLSIVLVAGVLKEKKKIANCWKEVEESISSHNIGSSEESMSIIGFSCKNLPNHLKPCFIYFGGFFRGKDIPVSKLSRVIPFPMNLKFLIHMRYLAVRITTDSIPSSMANLWNLETFVINELNRVLKLPCSLFQDLIWRTFPLHVSPLVKILRSMPNLRKLKCIVEGLLGYSTKGSIICFPRLDFLHHYPAKHPHEFNFPSKLRELTLSNFRLPWTQMLTVLKLLFQSL